MSALTVTLGADITALKRAMAGATELVGASARPMSKMTGAGLAGLGKGGAAALGKGFSVAGTVLKAGVGAALAGGAAAMRADRVRAYLAWCGEKVAALENGYSGLLYKIDVEDMNDPNKINDLFDWIGIPTAGRRLELLGTPINATP